MESESGPACSERGDENLDDKKILEMLKQDLNTRI